MQAQDSTVATTATSAATDKVSATRAPPQARVPPPSYGLARRVSNSSVQQPSASATNTSDQPAAQVTNNATAASDSSTGNELPTGGAAIQVEVSSTIATSSPAAEVKRTQAASDIGLTPTAGPDEGGVWNLVPRPFVEPPPARGPSVHDHTNRIAFVFFVVSAVAFTAVFASDVGHLLCPVQSYGTTCLSRSQFGADNSADAQWCDQLVAASCSATDDNPNSYYLSKSNPFSGSCMTKCLAHCTPAFCNGPLQASSSLPATGPSPVSLPVPYGVSSISGAATCAAFSRFLATYRVGASNSNSLACSSSFFPTDPECYASITGVPGWSTGSNGYYNKSTTATIKCCGTIANVAICPSTASTIGILSGYLSLWYSVVQSLFGIVLALQRVKSSSVPAGDDLSLEMTSTGKSM